MRKLFILFVGSLIAVSTQCRRGGDDPPEDPEPEPETDTVTRYDPVETADPNTDYDPAFEGQTRIYGVRTYTELDIEVINSSLSSPWGIINLPDNRLLVTQKGGTVVILTATGTVDKTITGLPAVNSDGQGGLLDVAIDPDFSSNRMIYWTFAENFESGTVTAVAKGRLSSAETTIEEVEVIYRAIPSYDGTLHYGGRLLFDQSGYLFVTTGERSDLATRPLAQDLSTALGKVLRITTDGEPAPGNPFIGDPDALPEIYSYGHRNVQGIALDKMNNIIYETELGPKGGDELNVIQAGKNYGWPTISYGNEYSGAPIGAGITQMDGMEQPLYYWDPVISPSGIVFYDMDVIPEWKNSVFAACLNGSHIVRLRIFDGRVAGEERLLDGLGERFRDLSIGDDGSLFAVTDGGKLFKISKK